MDYDDDNPTTRCNKCDIKYFTNNMISCEEWFCSECYQEHIKEDHEDDSTRTN